MLKYLVTVINKFKPEIIKYAQNLSALALQLQWIEGDASKAENSFFKINQQATLIDKTELKLLESRRKPNSIAARAIIRSGTGHKYWSSFPDEIQNQIQEIAKEINEILFEPKLQTPIKTFDVPVAGKLYSAQTLPLILDFVNIVNNIDFNTNRKSEIYIKKTLKNIPQCKICNGLIHRNSISFDHIQRKADGGLASLDNGQITHPYCNTGYKN
ncbi:HNH endonuclease [Nostoc sp. CHAB 5834]|nr:HNH endonuclease [Nostoc sp. CHAB 5834]